MLTVYSDDHRLQDGKSELNEGLLVPCFEKPARADLVLERVRATGFGDVLVPGTHGSEPLARVHDERYLEFLADAWPLWVAEHGEIDALPLNWPIRTLRGAEPKSIDGRLGYFSFDAGTPITAGTWRAATAAADVALTACDQVAGGERAVFALCRPPGHHAGRDFYGGYCFLNNAAIAAQALRDHGADRVAVLDVDYHHGNGTQAIFYERGDVLFLSLHADPMHEFPYFSGHADETGAAAGEGANRNYPLPWGTDFAAWCAALESALDEVRRFGAGALVVSLGVDTFEGDPISRFRLRSDDYPRIGERLAALCLPTVFVMEGGYAVEAIGVNVVNVLTGFGSG